MFNAYWDKLRIFYEVAKAGSFNAASEVLNISQPALSRSISILENHIQTRLFERLPRGLALTRQGEILIETIKKMSSELVQAQIAFEEEENEPVGSIRIAATAGFASLHLSVIIPEFLNRFPKMQLSIYGSDIIPNLHSNEADVVIAPFIHSDESLIQTYLTTFHLKLYASPEYIKRFGTPKIPKDLDHHRLLAYGDEKTPHPFSQANWHLTLGMEKGLVRQPYIMINSAIGLFNLAEGGMGITSVSKEHPPLKNSQLIEILPHIKGPQIDAYYIYSIRNKKIKRIELLKKFLSEKLKNHLPEDEIGD